MQNRIMSSSESKLSQFDDKPIINLPDILRENLDIIVVGITPSGVLGVSNHHFSGPGNHFWRCIAEVGLVPHPVTCEDDTKMLEYGIGFISFCTRPNKGTTELSRKEMKAGAALMVEKIKIYKPKIVVFNGIGIYEAFIGNKNFSMGLQPNKMDGTNSVIFVMPSSSARCAQLPRAEDKIPFFVSLKKLRDHIRGDLPQLEEKEVVFENYTEFRVTQPDPRSLLKAERRRKRKAELNAETALHENSQENTPSVHEDTKINPKIEPGNVKDDRSFETSQISYSSSIQNHSSIVTPPLLSWPQNGGLTIIHTGQPIIMPTPGNQTTPSNTLLLLDHSGLSFSSIPVPMNQTHLQVRPMILPTETESRLPPTTLPSTLVGTSKPNDIGGNLQPLIKARPTLSSNEIGKSIISVIKSSNRLTGPANDNTKPIATPIPTNSQPTTAAPAVSTPSESTKLVIDNVQLTSAGKMSSDSNQDSIQVDLAETPIQSNNVTTQEEVDLKYTNPINDPVDEWELFMNGIYTGEHSYPAPPQSVLVNPANAMVEYQEFLTQMNTSRILTVL